MATFPRSMNNIERSMLAQIKEYGFAYELKYIYTLLGGGEYVANIPMLKETWSLSSLLSKKHRERVEAFLKEIRT